MSSYEVYCCHEGCYTSHTETAKNHADFIKAIRSKGWRQKTVYGAIKDWFCPVHAVSGKKQKYNARKVVIDGITFDSEGEGKRWKDLQLLQADGQISNLRRGRRYKILSSFERDGVAYRAASYRPDFEYDENGRHVVEEYKSAATKKARDYMLRIKMFLHVYQEIVFREVMA